MNLKILKRMKVNTRRLFVSIGWKVSAKKDKIVSIYIDIKKIKYRHVDIFLLMVIVKKDKNVFIDM